MEVVITYRGGGEGGVDSDSEINFKFCLLSTRTLSGGFCKNRKRQNKTINQSQKEGKGLEKSTIFVASNSVLRNESEGVHFVSLNEIQIFEL